MGLVGAKRLRILESSIETIRSIFKTINNLERIQIGKVTLVDIEVALYIKKRIDLKEKLPKHY